MCVCVLILRSQIYLAKISKPQELDPLLTAFHSVPLRELSKSVLILISSAIERVKKIPSGNFCRVASVLELTYEFI